MRSPTAALLWEIWSRNRHTIAGIVGLTVAGALMHVSERAEGGGDGPSVLLSLLGWFSFVLLFGVFNYTDYGTSEAIGRFPRRLFTLPVSTLRLVALPVLTGIVAIELLYLAWMAPLAIGGSTSRLFIGVLLAAFMIVFQGALWMLERIGVLRLLVVGVVALAMFGVGLAPSFPPTPAPFWRSESVLAVQVTALAIGVFLLAWRYVAVVRAGGPDRHRSLATLVRRVADVWPTRRRPFAGPQAAQFWFEWRCSGIALPALVAGMMLLVIAPMSWVVRRDASDTMWLLLAALATPIVLAIPVGMAFSKPTFWSEDLSVPAFVAVRPLRGDDLVAIKLRVAAISVALAWIVVLSFVAVWFSVWGNPDDVSRLAIQLWAFHGHSVLAVYGIAALIVIVGMLLTWRSLVCRLWSGLFGSRRLFVASVLSVVFVGIAGMVFDVGRLPGWLLEDSERVTPFVWTAAGAVIAKYWLAVYAWRRVPPRYLRQYMPLWVTGTICCVTFALVLWGIVRIHVALDIYRFQSLAILLALLAVPVARVGFAPSCLEHNRHRSA